MPRCGQASLLVSRDGVVVESLGLRSVERTAEAVRAEVEVDEVVAEVVEAPDRTTRTLLARTTKHPSPVGHRSKRLRRVPHRLSRVFLPLRTIHPSLLRNPRTVRRKIPNPGRRGRSLRPKPLASSPPSSSSPLLLPQPTRLCLLLLRTVLAANALRTGVLSRFHQRSRHLQSLVQTIYVQTSLL